jgi:hypothetical protein
MPRRTPRRPLDCPLIGFTIPALLLFALNAEAQPAETGDGPEGSPPKISEADGSERELSAAGTPNASELEQLQSELQAQATRMEAQEKRVEELERRTEEAEQRAAFAEESAALAISLAEPTSDGTEASLELYGFADMAFSKKYIPEGSRFSGLVDPHSTFAMGNVNLYIDAKPHKNFRMLTEVRFTLSPHGNLNNDLTVEDTRAYDVTSATGRNRIIQSGIVMERAWIEWNQFPSFKVRTGYFLTPYGIWNVDHGSPTLISSVLPTFWASEYFPTHQLGIQVLGEVNEGNLEYGYRAYVSNGRLDSQIETDPFKNVGARLYVAHHGEVEAQLGASAFWGKNATYEKSVESFDPFLIDVEKIAQYEEYGLATDLSLDVSDLRVRTEFVLNQQEFEEGLRPATSPVTYQRDQVRWNVYGIIAYRLPFWELEPFIFIDHAKRPTATDNLSTVYSAGLIEHLAPGTQIKLQIYQVHFHNDDEFPSAKEDDFTGWDMRLVTAF